MYTQIFIKFHPHNFPTDSSKKQYFHYTKIRSVIREVEYASLCNNSSPNDSSCLKFHLEDTKGLLVILHRSKICILNRKRVLKKCVRHLKGYSSLSCMTRWWVRKHQTALEAQKNTKITFGSLYRLPNSSCQYKSFCVRILIF